MEDWSLSTTVLRRIVQLWGTPDVDLMASTATRKCPFFLSWDRADVKAIAFDALTADQDWSRWTLPYLFLPFPLIRKCLNKILEQRIAQIMVVILYWPGKLWFSNFLQMDQEVRQLPPRKDLVQDQVTGTAPSDVLG